MSKMSGTGNHVGGQLQKAVLKSVWTAGRWSGDWRPDDFLQFY